jgi:hypothetical protein
MKRLMAVTLLSLSMTGSAWGAGDSIWLHCVGQMEIHTKANKIKEVLSDVATVAMAKDGSWIKFGEHKAKRISKGLPGEWFYSSIEGTKHLSFTSDQMRILMAREDDDANFYRDLYCFPITNPFERYIE